MFIINKMASLNLPVDPLSDLTNQSNDTWNIIAVGHGRDNSDQRVITTTAGVKELRVFYPKGSYCPSATDAPQGGIGFYACPKTIFMADDVTFSYQLYFHDSFNPVLGGKMPGLYVGPGTTSADVSGASGGDHSKNSSVRVVWRANLVAEAYVYRPLHQDPAYNSIPNLVLNPTYGDSLWRGLFQFVKGSWNNVSVRIKVNSIVNGIAQPDGIVQLTINGVTETYNKMIWRTDNSHHVNAIVFDTFFGGSTNDWATPNDTWTYFRNMTVIRNSPHL